MGHMVAQMTEYQGWLLVETDSDAQILPLDLTGLDQEDVERLNRRFNGESGDADDSIPAEVRQYVGGSRLTAALELSFGWGVRSSAPWCMTCTEWDVYDRLDEAEAAYRAEEAANSDEEEDYEEEEDDEDKEGHE